MRAKSSRKSVSTSATSGACFSPGARSGARIEESEGRFIACGISLVAHMWNPYVPAVHMNLRYLRTSRGWFGGGSDLTPTFPMAEDTAEFHGGAQKRVRFVSAGCLR